MLKTPDISGVWFRESDKDEKETRIYERINSMTTSVFKTEDEVRKRSNPMVIPI